jgi:hypothetical protein
MAVSLVFERCANISCQAINGSFEAATAHKVGLTKMVSCYGGIWSLEENPVIVRVLSW